MLRCVTVASPEIKILLALGAASALDAYVCEIRLSRLAGRLGERVRKARPDLWSGLDFVARNWNGGHPGLKLLYRRHAAELRQLDRHFVQLRSLERRLLLGIVSASLCIGMVMTGSVFWGWNW